MNFYRFLLVVCICAFFSPAVFAQKKPSKLSENENANLTQGYEAYKNEDWVSAIFFLRKVVSAPGSANDETLFMLIKSEVYAGEYKQAQADCEKFLEQFAFSPYREYIQYQNGRLLHLLARNEDSVLAMSDFCHQNPESDLYPMALFWIAEAFYDEYNFEPARGLYERLVEDYPACEKAPQAQYKLDLIERRTREEKLLYLLKVIGEENLSTREEYERQIRVYQLEDQLGVKKELIDALARIAELEALLEGSEPVYVYAEPGEEEPPKDDGLSVAEVKAPEPERKVEGAIKQPVIKTVIQTVNESSIRVKNNNKKTSSSAAPKSSGDSNSSVTASDAEVQALKRKAKQLQYLLDEQSEDGEK